MNWIDDEYPEATNGESIRRLMEGCIEPELMGHLMERYCRPNYPSFKRGVIHQAGKNLDEIKSPTKRWLAKKYDWNTILVSLDPFEDGSIATEWRIASGVSLFAEGVDPNDQSMPDDPSTWELIWLFRRQGEWAGAGAIRALKAFVNHLEAEPQSRVQAVFLRPESPNDNRRMEYLKSTNYIPDPDAGTANLKKAYAKILGAYESGRPDNDGGYYWSVPFSPAQPDPDVPPMRFPELLVPRKRG